MVKDGKLFVGVARLEIHIPEARSLKAKRSVTRRLVERVRSRHQVLAVEAEHQDLYQRSGLAFCAMSTDPVDVEARLQRVRNTIDEIWDGPILGWEIGVHQL